MKFLRSSRKVLREPPTPAEKRARRRRILQALFACAAVALIAWGAGMIHRALTPIVVGAALLAELLTTKKESD